MLEFENNHDFLEILFKSIEEGLVVVSKERDIVYVNKRAEELFDYTQSELLGKKIEMLIPSKYYAGHPDNLQTFADNPAKKRMGAESIELMANMVCYHQWLM